MSNFPFPWWDKTITLYNKFVDPTTQRVTWYRTVIENCFWKNVNELYNMGRYGMSAVGVQLEVKNIICRIPEDDRYVDKRKWKELTNREDYFTLGSGDIIILGEVEDVVDEYTEGIRSNDLLTKYKEFDECLQIMEYVDNVRPGVSLRHYRVFGK